MKKLLVLIIIVSAFIFPSVVKANILINEISSGTTDDWVELFNVSTESASLVGYKITDSDGNKVDLSGNISAGGFASFDFSNRLNNSGDTVNLYNGVDANSIDSITYGGSNVCAPQGTETIGRYPDGTTFIDKLSTSTRNFSNTWDAAHACPSPSPSPTQTPAPTVSPTPSPSATSSPTPAKSPTPKPTPTPTPMGIRDNSATPQADVLGLRDSLAATDAPTQKPGTSSGGNSFPIIAGVFIVAGIALMAFAIYWGMKKQKENSSATISE